jgi:hypothetical protein
MKILLVNDNGQTVAQLSDVEKFDGSLAGSPAGLRPFLQRGGQGSVRNSAGEREASVKADLDSRDEGGRLKDVEETNNMVIAVAAADSECLLGAGHGSDY